MPALLSTVLLLLLIQQLNRYLRQIDIVHLFEKNGYALLSLDSGHLDPHVVRALLLYPVQAAQTQGLYLVQDEKEVGERLLFFLPRVQKSLNVTPLDVPAGDLELPQLLPHG